MIQGDFLCFTGVLQHCFSHHLPIANSFWQVTACVTSVLYLFSTNGMASNTWNLTAVRI